MTTQLPTGEQLAAILARHGTATSGTWYLQPNYGPHFVAAEHHGYEHGIGTLDFGEGDQADADREFVLNAHEDVAALLAEVDRLRAERARYRAAWHSARRRAGENRLAGQRFTGGAIRDALVRAGYITRRDTVVDAVRKINEAPRPWYVRWLVDRLQYAARAHASTVLQAQQQASRADQLVAELGGRDEAARERWIQKQEQQLGLKYADFRTGRWEMDLAMGREMAAAYVAMAKTLLGDAPNYTETRLEFDVKIAEQPELYTLVVQRHAPGALTPHEARQRAESERDGAYRERAQLLAWLASLYPAVLAPAPDVDEPGWQILYLTASGQQLSWHIHPRDAELFAHVQQVPADDPRAQWDGHTTEQKYQRVSVLIAAADAPSTRS
ncbi:hypothetical protein [Kitasatospora acidiphila]|uniref:hypothetical protein n=1 Tax=Kitasatospora acidiphila TaxID=2567942 RepID=UPI0015F00A6E|nr:hypothetical protein [Kitasatospora acidiphila]